MLAPDGALFIATEPYDLQPQDGIIRGQWGTSNVFEVNPQTGVASLIASVRASVANFPVAANTRYVAWTEDYCNVTGTPPLSNGRTRIYDRRTKTLTEFDQGFFVAGLTPDDQLAVGSFGADALIDIETLRYTVVFPERDRMWSDSYRYAAVGITGGHGGNCGGT